MKDLTHKEFVDIRDYIRANFGIALGDEKKSLIYSRLRTELEQRGFEDFTHYFNHLKNDKTGESVIAFIDRITTNHTFFMRESDHFDYFRDTVLPWIEEGYKSTKDLRLWCAASSSGEEPYTLQMIIEDYFRGKPDWNTETIATDISTKVLDKAVAGVYPAESVETLPKRWVNGYFTKSGPDSYAVKAELKKKVFYRKINLMEERLPFRKPLQVIFCRNVMIYFDAATREALVNRFFNILDKGGYLFIGHSESLSHSNTGYKYIMPAVYRKPL